MPSIDVEKFLAQNGVRRSRFGGFDEDDVRAALRTLCAEYDQRLNHVQGEWKRLSQENASLVQQCRTLAGQNRMLSSQNATLAGNGEQASRRSQELGTEVSRLQERNRSLHDQCAVLRLKNNDLKDENASLKAAADQAEAALRLRGKELADEIAALRASRQQKLNEAAAEANTTLADARRQADALLAEAQAQAEAIEETARRQARAQAQNLVDAAAAEANEIQNAHQLRLNELAAEVRRMEARRERMIQYFNQVGNELLRTGTAAEAVDLTVPEPGPDAGLPDDFVLHEVPTPAAELDLSAAAIAAVRDPASAARPDSAAAEPDSTKAQAGPETDARAADEYTAPAQEIAPPEAAAAPRRAFTLAEEDDTAPAAPPAAAAEAKRYDFSAAADLLNGSAPAPAPAPAQMPDALAEDAWQDLTLDPAPAPSLPDRLAGSGSLWPDLPPAAAAAVPADLTAPPSAAPSAVPPAAPTDAGPIAAAGSWAAGTAAAAVWEDEPDGTAAVSTAARWQDLNFDGPEPLPAGLAAAAPGGPAAVPDPAALWPETFDTSAAPATSAVTPAAPAAPVTAAAPATPAAPAVSAKPESFETEMPVQTAPGLTEVPGAIFSSPIVRQPDPAPLAAAAPATAPRAPLLPGQEPDPALEDEDTLSGLVAAPGAPGAGVAWQHRHKAIRAIQALRRLYR